MALSSFKIGSVLGITIRVHVLLLLLFAWLLLQGATHEEGWLPVAWGGVLFLIVLLHELGHCLVARAYGIRVVDITLWPLGGMARMSAMPESSAVEARVAIAGPAVNFALAALAAPVLFAGDAAPWIAKLAFAFVAANLMLGLFNLLPAFPMDGGRILRAFLARRGDWLGATERAVLVGRWIALVLAIVGVVGLPGWLEPSLALPFVALFVWWSGRQELAQVRARHRPAGDNPLAELLRRFAAAQRGARDVEHADAASASETPRAPVGGFTPEKIAELERFRGRLSSYRGDDDSDGASRRNR